MKASNKGYTVHGILGGPGYHPVAKIGYIEQLPHDYPASDFVPLDYFTAVGNKVKKSQRKPYVGNNPLFVQERVAPGYYKLSDPYLQRGNVENANSQIPQNKNFKYAFPEDLRDAVVVHEMSDNAARAPRQWLRPEVEIDMGEDEMFDYFANISSEALNAKKELLRLKGFSESEIDTAIADLRKKEIEKNLKSANIVSLPSIVIPQSVVMADGVATSQPDMVVAQRVSGRQQTRFPKSTNQGSISFTRPRALSDDEVSRRSVTTATAGTAISLYGVPRTSGPVTRQMTLQQRVLEQMERARE